MIQEGECLFCGKRIVRVDEEDIWVHLSDVLKRTLIPAHHPLPNEWQHNEQPEIVGSHDEGSRADTYRAVYDGLTAVFGDKWRDRWNRA